MKRNEATFYFKREADGGREFNGRVFPKDYFNITFSNTKQANDEFVVMTFYPNETRIVGLKEVDAKQIFEFGKSNEFTINLTSSSITLNNPMFSDSLNFEGNFDKMKYVGFYSESSTAWLLSKSMI